MARNAYSVLVPGSLMLMGEHAVLKGHPCLVAALDQRMCVSATVRSDRDIQITSALGKVTWCLDALPSTDPVFTFILAVVHALQAELSHGYDIRVEATFSDQLGFGSSAAVVVGTLAVLTQSIRGTSIPPMELLALSRRIIQSVQGFGSGADVAASIFGGVVLHIPEVTTRVIAKTLPLVVVYSGAKEKTTVVVKKVNDRMSLQPTVIQPIYEAMHQGVLAGVSAIQAQDWLMLGQIMNTQHGLMNALGVSNISLETLLHLLRESKGVWGAKISGSGLGDCVIATGCLSQASDLSLSMPQRQLHVSVSPEGLQYVM
ncbi:MAG: mevalonate kinase [Pseudomonadota bacterium]|jgi:mevalonate kinase